VIDTTADNIVPLAENIIKNGEETKAVAELERARQITLRAFDITAKQLEKDALRFEEQAIVGEVPIQRRHELMDHARALRVACGWLQMLVTPEQNAT